MFARRLAWTLLIVAACAAGLPGCATPEEPWKTGLWNETPPDYPFVPNRVLVHPLTRAAESREGEWRLRVHFLFLDAWEDQVKGLGQVQVQLLADGEFDGDRIEPVAWEQINLNDLTTNRSHYDNVTRTYVLEVPQSAMPEWLPSALDELDAARQEGGVAYRSFAGRLTIRVVYRATMANGEEVVTSNDFVLAPG